MYEALASAIQQQLVEVLPDSRVIFEAVPESETPLVSMIVHFTHMGEPFQVRFRDSPERWAAEGMGISTATRVQRWIFGDGRCKRCSKAPGRHRGQRMAIKSSYDLLANTIQFKLEAYLPGNTVRFEDLRHIGPEEIGMVVDFTHGGKELRMMIVESRMVWEREDIVSIIVSRVQKAVVKRFAQVQETPHG